MKKKYKVPIIFICIFALIMLIYFDPLKADIARYCTKFYNKHQNSLTVVAEYMMANGNSYSDIVGEEYSYKYYGNYPFPNEVKKSMEDYFNNVKRGSIGMFDENGESYRNNPEESSDIKVVSFFMKDIVVGQDSDTNNDTNDDINRYYSLYYTTLPKDDLILVLKKYEPYYKKIIQINENWYVGAYDS